MRMYGRLALHAESVVLPLLAPDAPVVTWWHADAAGADRLRPARRVRRPPDHRRSIARPTRRPRCGSAPTDYAPGDTDLAWTRITSWRAILASSLDSVSGRRGEAGRRRRAAGSRATPATRPRSCSPAGSPRAAACADRRQGRAPASPGRAASTSVVLQLDQKEEVRIQADRRGGAVITQPFRPDTTVALPERALGDLLSEELRRLDPDEPYSDALEAATGVTGLADRSPDARARLVRPGRGRRQRLPAEEARRERS